MAGYGGRRRTEAVSQESPSVSSYTAPTLTAILLCLRRCLLNVVGNSLKFTRAGTVKITLRDAGLIPSAPPLRYSPPLEEEVERRLITFTVADTGIGMTDDFVRDRKYLTPFVQADPFV